MTRERATEIIEGAMMLLGDGVSPEDEQDPENETGQVLAGLGELSKWVSDSGCWEVQIG